MAKLSLDLPIKRDNWNCRQRTLQNAPREPYKLERLLSVRRRAVVQKLALSYKDYIISTRAVYSIFEP